MAPESIVNPDGTMWVQTADGFDELVYARDGLNVWISAAGKVAKFSLAEAASEDAGKEAVAPMTGKVLALPVDVGDTVAEGDTLAVLEAMKMEYRLEAEADGEVSAISAKVGDLVDLGHVLVRLK
jgi:biotin carboxyl carrier protein